MNRLDFENYLVERYDAQPEHPWMRYPDNTVFRHRSNNKWFAIVMAVEKRKLGIDEDGAINIVNLKLEPLMVEALRLEDGFYPAYHMHKESWISVALDERVSAEKMEKLVDISYELTDVKKKRKQSKAVVHSKKHSGVDMAVIKDKVVSRPAKLQTGYRSREAAVLLPLVQGENGWEVLFQVRSRKLRSQPGDICFPGGAIDDGESREVAAVREVCEELCIDASQVELIGAIDSTLGPKGAPMWAFAGILHDYQGSYSTDEVEEVFTVPLEQLLAITPIKGEIVQTMEPDEDFPSELIPNHDTYSWSSNSREILFYPWEDRMIWGATARVLHHFLERLR